MTSRFPRSPLLALTVLLACSATYVHAQMYSWMEPGTGQRRISGSPPAWYGLDSARGPRTVVTLGVFLLDDTGLSPVERARVQAAAKQHLANREAEATGDEPVATGARRQAPPPPPPALSRGGPRRESKP